MQETIVEKQQKKLWKSLKFVFENDNKEAVKNNRKKFNVLM